eukprot:m.91836 g.91836  ORF g.91836 m.91836 type:complete len:109 (-) comp26504_c0_seq1:102-428(-)
MKVLLIEETDVHCYHLVYLKEYPLRSSLIWSAIQTCLHQLSDGHDAIRDVGDSLQYRRRRCRDFAWVVKSKHRSVACNSPSLSSSLVVPRRSRQNDGDTTSSFVVLYN